MSDPRRARLELRAAVDETPTDDELRVFAEAWTRDHVAGAWNVGAIAPAGDRIWLVELAEVPRGNGA